MEDVRDMDALKDKHKRLKEEVERVKKTNSSLKAELEQRDNAAARRYPSSKNTRASLNKAATKALSAAEALKDDADSCTILAAIVALRKAAYVTLKTDHTSKDQIRRSNEMKESAGSLTKQLPHGLQ